MPFLRSLLARATRSVSTMSSPKVVKFALAQVCSTSNLEQNLHQCRDFAESAKAQGASFIAFPECFDFIGLPGESLKMAEPLDGPLMTKYRGIAKSTGLWISYGGFHEATAEQGRIRNTHLVVNPNGDFSGVYRKVHMFDVDVADGKFRESSGTTAGTDMVVVDNTPLGTIGLTTCYDLRFPELYAALANAGANLILVPSAFMPTTGEAHWEVLLRARAIENQCFIAAAAQCGANTAKRSSYGHALVVDPWGKVLADLGADKPGLTVVELDLSLIGMVRSRIPRWNHRRLDVYAKPVQRFVAGKVRGVTQSAVQPISTATAAIDDRETNVTT